MTPDLTPEQRASAGTWMAARRAVGTATDKLTAAQAAARAAGEDAAVVANLATAIELTQQALSAMCRVEDTR
jgi:hypothetical protein